MNIEKGLKRVSIVFGVIAGIVGGGIAGKAIADEIGWQQHGNWRQPNVPGGIILGLISGVIIYFLVILIFRLAFRVALWIMKGFEEK